MERFEGARKPPVSLEEVKRAYAEQGSMRAAGAKLGISGARVHQILQGYRDMQPLTVADRNILKAIINHSSPVLRGPSSEQIAEALGIKPRALRYRIARLRRLNLIYVDSDKGFLPTDEARARL